MRYFTNSFFCPRSRENWRGVIIKNLSGLLTLEFMALVATSFLGGVCQIVGLAITLSLFFPLWMTLLLPTEIGSISESRVARRRASAPGGHMGGLTMWGWKIIKDRWRFLTYYFLKFLPNPPL